MRRPARWRFSPALLLIEAVITVAVVAVSLVFITRAFSTGLRAMDQARRYETLVHVAQRQLIDLETQGELTQQLPTAHRGEVVADKRRFQWDLALDPFLAPNKELAGAALDLDRLVLTVAEVRDTAPIRISLTTLVPMAWSRARSGE